MPGKAAGSTLPGVTPKSASPPERKLPNDRYHLRREIGHGRYATVHLAKDRETGRKVVLKIFRSELTADPEVARALERQLAVAASLRNVHESIAAPLAHGRLQDGRLFVAMEHLPGPTLREILRSSAPLPLERAVRLVWQLAHALEAAHARGVVHGDIRPEQIIVVAEGEENEAARLTGFEEPGPGTIAKLDEARSTTGAADYRAPELAEGQAPTARTDTFGLGVLFYEMVTGALPSSPTARERLARHLDAADTLVAALTGVRPLVERQIWQALQARPEDRPEHIVDLVDDYLHELALDAWEEAQGGRLRLRGMSGSLGTWVREARRGLLVLAACLLVSVILVFIFARYRSADPAGHLLPAEPLETVAPAATAPEPAPPVPSVAAETHADTAIAETAAAPAATDQPATTVSTAKSVAAEPERPAASLRARSPRPPAKPARAGSRSARHLAAQRMEPPAPTSAQPAASPPASQPQDGSAAIDWLFKQSR